MKYDPEKHHRRSIRLKGYDYSQAGAYFITIVTQGRTCLFGDVEDGEMRLSTWGEIAREEWFKTAQIRPYVRLHDAEFVVMPNHVHGIIWIVDDDDNVVGARRRHVGARRRRAPTGRDAPVSDHDTTVERFGVPVCGSIPTIVRAFKSATTKRVNALRNTPGAPVWQRNYSEHIIRSEESLNRIRDYIANNPLQWEWDRENPNV